MDTEKKSEREETLAERSARLEQEAKAYNNPPYAAHDPLSPESLNDGPEQTTEPHEDAPATPIHAEGYEALKAELAQAKDQTMRALADAENTRRRAQKEREDTSKYAISGFAKEMLDVSDNLRRALDAMPAELVEAEPRLKNLIDGIEATERTLLRSFEKHGIKKLDPIHEIFNPNFHEVMFEAPMPDKAPGTVIQVMEAGYTIHDRLLRPARVGVVRDDGQGNGGGEPTYPGGHIDTSA